MADGRRAEINLRHEDDIRLVQRRKGGFVWNT